MCISNVWNGRLDLGGFSETINGLWGDGLVTNTAASACTLTVGGNNMSSTFTGTINSGSGSVALVKTGSGTLSLGGANTYTGGTTISGGTLEGAVSGSIPGNVNNAAGTLQLDNAAATASSATLTLASAPSAGAGYLNCSGSQTIAALYFGSTQKAAGTWANSGAAHNNPAFTGSGVLYVATGPASITILSLTSGSDPCTYGDSLIFTATVMGNLPSGTVQFLVDGSPVGGPVALVGGSAPLVVSTLTVSGSPHQITAAYSGDDNNNPSSTANAWSETVLGAGTTTALLSSQNPSAPGSNVTFTATVSSGVGTPAGNVVFLANAVPFSTNGLVAGVATASTTTLPLGTNTVVAQYATQGNYLGSSDTVEQVVQSATVYSQTNVLSSIVNNGDGTITLSFVGTPQAQYYVVASPDATAAMSSWAPLVGSTNTVTDPNGLWSFTVTNTATQQFYRSAAVNPAP